MNRIAAIRARLAAENGYSLVEMLTVMIVLAVVMGAISTLLVQGSKAELDMNNRFQAQSNARLALDRLRREVHCASDITPAGASASVTLAMPSHCPTAGGSPSVTWCTQSAGTNRYQLWRYVGAACSGTGVAVADYLTSQTVFTFTAQSVSSLALLGVVFAVDLEPGKGAIPYTLTDDIVLRNSTRI